MRPVRRHGIGIQRVVRRLGRRRSLIGLGVLASLFVIMSLVASAATGQAGKGSVGPVEQAPVEAPGDVPDPGIGSMALKVMGSVLLLIGILYAGVYAMRALSGRTGRGGSHSNAISVLHKTHIAPKKAIYVVKVGEKAMVVGVTDSQINHLSDLSQEDLGSLGVPEKSASKGRSFRQHLMGFALGVKGRP